MRGETLRTIIFAASALGALIVPCLASAQPVSSVVCTEIADTFVVVAANRAGDFLRPPKDDTTNRLNVATLWVKTDQGALVATSPCSCTTDAGDEVWCAAVPIGKRDLELILVGTFFISRLAWVPHDDQPKYASNPRRLDVEWDKPAELRDSASHHKGAAGGNLGTGECRWNGVCPPEIVEQLALYNPRLNPFGRLAHDDLRRALGIDPGLVRPETRPLLVRARDLLYDELHTPGTRVYSREGTLEQLERALGREFGIQPEVKELLDTLRTFRSDSEAPGVRAFLDESPGQVPTWKPESHRPNLESPRP